MKKQGSIYAVVLKRDWFRMLEVVSCLTGHCKIAITEILHLVVVVSWNRDLQHVGGMGDNKKDMSCAGNLILKMEKKDCIELGGVYKK